MNVTCQITQQSAGRIRLVMPNDSLDPESKQVLAHYVLGLPDVTGIELRPAGSSIVILHSGGRQAGAQIVRLLRGAPSAGSAIEEVSVTSGSTDGTGKLPYARAELQHTMRGRVRLRLPILKTDEALAGVLSDFLVKQPGIAQVRVNRPASSIAISFDPTATDAGAIAAAITAFNPDPETIENWRTSRPAPQLDPMAQQRRRTLERSLAGVALALSILFGGVAAFFVYALLLGAIGSILERTYRWAFRRRHATFDLAASVVMALLMVRGMVWQAALIPFVWWGATLLQSRLSAQRQHAKTVEETIVLRPAQTIRSEKAPIQDEQVTAPVDSQNSVGELRSSILNGLILWAVTNRLHRTRKQTK